LYNLVQGRLLKSGKRGGDKKVLVSMEIQHACYILHTFPFLLKKLRPVQSILYQNLKCVFFHSLWFHSWKKPSKQLFFSTTKQNPSVEKFGGLPLPLFLSWLVCNISMYTIFRSKTFWSEYSTKKHYEEILVNIDMEATDEYDGEAVVDPILLSLLIIKVVVTSSLIIMSSRMIILRLISIKARSPRRKGSRSGGNLVFKMGIRPWCFRFEDIVLVVVVALFGVDNSAADTTITNIIKTAMHCWWCPNGVLFKSIAVDMISS